MAEYWNDATMRWNTAMMNDGYRGTVHHYSSLASCHQRGVVMPPFCWQLVSIEEEV
jgi:hypothetical protein